jgi:O-antigen/teichoic acid export membrane protein
MAKQKSFINAIKWSYTGTWGERAFGAIFTLVLAAVLGPRDFGIITIAGIYIAFLQMFLEQGFVAALIQKQNLQREHLNSVFWMNLGLSLGLVTISILLSHWWANLNRAPQVAALVSVLSLCIPIEGLSIVQRTLLSRDMDFKSLSIRSNISVLVGGIVGLGMAFAGLGVWSLVGQQLGKDVTALILLWSLSPWRPQLEFSASHLKDLMGFSFSNFVAQLGMFADVQASAILLAVIIGPVAVGLYRLADRLMNSVLAMATASIQAVSLPEFSRFQSEPDKLRKSALSCIRLSSTVTLPALSGLAAVSTPLMIVLGPKWIPASGVLKVLCVLGMVLVFHFFTGPLLQALSKTKEIVALEWGRAVVGVACLLVAGYFVRGHSITWQVMGVALARLLTSGLIVTPIFMYILMRLCDISLRDLATAVAPSATASIAVLGTVILLEYFRAMSGAKTLVFLIAEILLGGIIGIVVLLIMDMHLRGVVIRMFRKPKNLTAETL